MTDSPKTSRNYDRFADDLRAAVGDDASREEHMRAVAVALWDALHVAGYSWCGFYTISAGGEGEAMILGPSRDTTACSPIGLNGVGGQG